MDDFMCQRAPWQPSSSGTPLLEFPGVDDLVAYWLGRYDGFLAEATAGSCTRYTQ